MTRPGSEADADKGARVQITFGVVCAALLVCGLAQTLTVVAIRYLIAGQIGLRGLDTFAPALEALQKVEGLVAPGIAVVVSLSVGSRSWNDLKYGNRKPDPSNIDWVWSFWIPILIGAVIFLMIYNDAFGNAVPGGRDV